MIGVSMTNAAPQVVATYGKRSLLGTNPISVAVPTNRERPFILDMATSVGAAGKVEIARRTGKLMPDGWLVDAPFATASEHREAYTRYLARRLETPRAFLEEAIRARA